jgi:hypothetical protein
MNRSTMAMLAGSPSTPKRRRISRRLHQRLNPRQRNCLALSVTT